MNPCYSLIASLNSNAQPITLPKDSRLTLPEPILVTGTHINGFLFFKLQEGGRSWGASPREPFVRREEKGSRLCPSTLVSGEAPSIS